MKSLRSQLVYFWMLLLMVCLALGAVMLVLYRQSAGAQIAGSLRSAESACDLIAARYAKSLAQPRPSAPQIDLLNVLLQIVLIETPHVEGGVWSRSGGFLAYAYPTYEGSGGIKRDVPEAERNHIAELSGSAAQAGKRQTDVVRATREALIVSACPLSSSDGSVVAWTMTRTPTAFLDAQGSLRIGLGVLLSAVLAAGLWLGALLLRGWREVQRLESRLDDATEDALAQPLPATGIPELDRIVAALNRSRQRSVQMQASLRESERQRARDQRLAALGRMTGGIAHEIRNPIAAMRLKAENALAAPEAANAASLQTILGQVERLDLLVQRLLAMVQPLTLDPQAIDLDAWLHARVDAFRAQAAAKGVRLVVEARALQGRALQADAVHLGRAVDNLLDNAVRHARSEVRVSVEARAAEAVVRIADDGPGIPDALREQLFEPFATGRRDGTGLGLAMARDVLLAHRGDLRFVARAEGACFDLSLPWQDS